MTDERTKTGRVLTDADFEALADEAERGYDVSHIDPEAGQLRAQRDRLLRVAAAALERTQVGDADEATALLEQVVTLAGEYVPYTPPDNAS